MEARTFAESWIADWNRKDVEAVLSHFSDDAVFTSPRAKAIVGSPRVEGKAKLKEYWTRAVQKIQAIHFALDYVIQNDHHMAIVYTAEVDGKRIRAVEFLTFGANGLIREGEVMHGIEL